MNLYNSSLPLFLSSLFVKTYSVVPIEGNCDSLLYIVFREIDRFSWLHLYIYRLQWCHVIKKIAINNTIHNWFIMMILI